MKFFNYLDPNLIFLNVEGRTKEEIFLNIIDEASKSDESIKSEKDNIIKGVLDREKKLTTSIGEGFSIPHARISNYDDMMVVVATPKEMVVDSTVDGNSEQLKIFFLIVTSDTKNKLMLNLMSCVSKLSKKEEFTNKIDDFKSADELFQSIKSLDIMVNSEMLAEDIMNVDISPVSLKDNLQFVASRLVSEKITALPVEGEDGKFVGEVTEAELINYGMPKITSMMKSLSFLRDEELFGNYFKNELTVRVGDIYRKKAIVVDRKASVMEVAFSMLDKKCPRAYVVEGDKYFGFISRSDIIKKVLHI